MLLSNSTRIEVFLAGKSPAIVNMLYIFRRVIHNLYCYRRLHTELVKCGSDVEYLAKVYCLRQAYSKLFNSPDVSEFIADIGRQIISDLIIYADRVREHYFTFT